MASGQPRPPLYAVIGTPILFLLLVAGFVAWVVRPGVQMVRVGSWVPQACTAISASVYGDGMYGVHVAYRWTAVGRTWEGDRYSFVAGSTNDLAHWKAVAAQFAEGRTITCYVDPADPAEAVVERQNFGSLAGLGGLMSLFVVAFGWGTVTNLRAWRARREDEPPPTP